MSSIENAVVTGATGFIGRHVVQHLLKNNVKVYALVRDRKKAELLFDNDAGLVLIECDLSHSETLPHLISAKTVDVCYHFAWEGVSGQNLQDFDTQNTNVRYTMNLIQIMHTFFSVKKFVGAGSIHEMEFAYAEKNGLHMGMENMYKCSKQYAHYVTKIFCNSHNITFCWPIITNTYGAGETSQRLIATTIQKLKNNISPSFSSGLQLYDFMYVSDVASAFYLIGLHGKNNRHYVICNDTPKMLKDYLTKLGTIVNPNVPLHFGQEKITALFLPKELFDNRELLEDTDFSPLISFEEGIYKTANWK